MGNGKSLRVDEDLLPRRHGRLLRLRRRTLRSLAYRQARGRRWTSQPARRRLRRILRRPQIRRSFRDATPHRRAPLPASYLRRWATPTRYREYSGKVYEVLKSFSPQVDMASVDEAYMDLTGTERLHGPPTLRRPIGCTTAMKRATALNCSIGIAASRMVAKVASDQAKPNGVLWVLPGEEARFSLAPLDVRKIPGVGKVTEKNLQAWGVRKVGDLAALDEDFLHANTLGQWGLALAGKIAWHGRPAAGSMARSADDSTPKSISHEFTFNEDTADTDALESTLARLSEMVAPPPPRARLACPHHSVEAPLFRFLHHHARAFLRSRHAALDTEIFQQVRALFRVNRKPNATVRLLGVHASGLKTRRRPAQHARRTEHRPLAQGHVRRRSPARQVRRGQRFARHGHEGPPSASAFTRIRPVYQGRLRVKTASAKLKSGGPGNETTNRRTSRRLWWICPTRSPSARCRASRSPCWS